jgi:membrane protein
MRTFFGGLYSRLLSWLDDRNEGQSRQASGLRRILSVIVITLREFHRNDLSLRAAALTLTILLSLVPILAISTAVIKGLGGDNHLKQLAYDSIAIFGSQEMTAESDSRTVPADISFPEHLRSAVDKIFAYVDRTNFTTLGTIGTLALVVSIMLVLHQIEAAMNVIWHVKSGRSFLRKVSDYITLLVLMPLAVNIGFAASAFIESPELLARVDALVPAPWLQGLLLKAIPIFFITLTLHVIYVFFPNTRVRTLPALAGSILAAICWFGAQSLFVSMQIGVSRYNAIYGSFATLPLLLLWIQLVWVVVLAGAQFAFTLQNSDRLQLTSSAAGPEQRLGAAFAVMVEVQRAFEHQELLTVKELAEHLPGHQEPAIGEITGDLVEAGLIHRSSTDGRLLPCAPADAFRPSRLIELINRRRQ